MTRRILVTGGAGYLGNVLTQALVAQGWSVVVVDRFFFGDAIPDHNRITKVVMDTRQLRPELLAGCEAVIDLAAISNDPAGAYFDQVTRDINHRARVHTAVLARNCGVPRYILPSSCSVYGCAEGVVDEESPVNPITTYARANHAAEKDILDLASPSFTVTALRLATLYGDSPRLRLDLVANNMCFRASMRQPELVVFGSGHQERPLVHVLDVVAALEIVLGAAPRQINGEIFNIGSVGGNRSIGEVAVLVQEVASKRRDREVSIRHERGEDPRSYRVDFSKARRYLGLGEGIALDTGIGMLLERLLDSPLTSSTRHYTLERYKELDALGQGPRSLSASGVVAGALS